MSLVLSEIKNKMKDKEERMKIIEYYNNSPTDDLIPDEIGIVELCNIHQNVSYCKKCLLVHHDNHKCYVYDRLFASCIGYCPYMLFSRELLKKLNGSHRYGLEWNDVSGSITAIWIDGTEFQKVGCDFCETCAQRYYDWEDEI